MDDYGPSRKKRKGGVQQRLAASRVDQPDIIESELATLLLFLLAWGLCSAQLCQKIAECAVKDMKRAVETGALLSKLEKLAGAGATNAARDIRTAVRTEPRLPKPFVTEIPFKAGDAKTAIMLPHEQFAATYAEYPEVWNAMMVPGEDALPEFWRSASDHPQMSNHPLLSRSDYQTRCVPVAIHGDETPLTGRGKIWCQSAVIFSWFSLLAGTSSTQVSMIYIWSAFEKLIDYGVRGTIEIFWKIMLWSFTVLFFGVWPSHDWRDIERLSYNLDCFNVCFISFFC